MLLLGTIQQVEMCVVQYARMRSKQEKNIVAKFNLAENKQEKDEKKNK